MVHKQAESLMHPDELSINTKKEVFLKSFLDKPSRVIFLMVVLYINNAITVHDKNRLKHKNASLRIK